MVEETRRIEVEEDCYSETFDFSDSLIEVLRSVAIGFALTEVKR